MRLVNGVERSEAGADKPAGAPTRATDKPPPPLTRHRQTTNTMDPKMAQMMMDQMAKLTPEQVCGLPSRGRKPCQAQVVLGLMLRALRSAAQCA